MATPRQPGKTILQVHISDHAKCNLRVYAAMAGLTLTAALEHILTKQIGEIAQGYPQNVSDGDQSPSLKT